MSELEQNLQIILKQVEDSQIKLRKYNEDFRQLFVRLEEMCVQHKRRAPLTDISFEQDFRNAIEDLRKLSDCNYVFWKEIRDKYYSQYKKMLTAEYRFLIKQISVCAIAFTRQTDELFTIYKNLQNLGKDLPLRLNWWVFESSTQDLLNTTSRILFLVRSMEKHYV